MLHRRRGQRGKADHVADGIDVVDLGLEVVIDVDPASLVAGQPGQVEVQFIGAALPARRQPHGIGRDLLARFQDHHGPAVVLFDEPDGLAHPEGDCQIPELILESATIPRSQKSSIRGRCSTTVTLVPRAANIEAYSMPMTPAPTTTMLGMCFILRI